jgi:hypothetical protein
VNALRRLIIGWLAALAAILGLTLPARGTTVEFNDGSPTPGNLSSLAGSTAFAADDLSFAGSTLFAVDPRFLGAGTDDDGVITGPGVTTAEILFNTPVTDLTISAVRVNTDFYASAYDGNQLLFTYAATGGTGTQYDQYTFTGTITELDFHDHGGYVGVGRLTFDTVASDLTDPPPVGSTDGPGDPALPEPACLSGVALTITLLLRRVR